MTASTVSDQNISVKLFALSNSNTIPVNLICVFGIIMISIIIFQIINM